MHDSREDDLLPVLRAALNQTRSAACITSSQLDWPGPEIVYVNPAYSAMTGRDQAEVIGQTPRVMQGPLTDRAVLKELRSSLDDGLPFVGETVNYKKDGSPFLINWRIDPVVSPGGGISHYVATQEDVTSRRRTERLLAAEQRIGRSVAALIGEPGETAANLEALGREVVGAMAVVAGYGKVSFEGSIRLGTATATSCSGVPWDERGERVGGLDRHVVGLQSGQIDGRHWVGSSLHDKRSGLEGILVVWDLEAPERDFLDDEGVSRVVGYGARALESLAQHERDRLLVLELQRGLLPTAPVRVPGLEVTALYQPGAFGTRIGGDWYDVFRGDERAVLVVGDMAGSGVRAAADMGRLRLLVRIMLQQGADLPRLFSELNQYCSDEDLVATVLAVTVALGDDGMPTGMIKIASAGHPPPLRKSGLAVDFPKVGRGPLLGIGGDPSYREASVELAREDSLVLFTDGLVERRSEAIDTSLEEMVMRTTDRWSEQDPSIETLCSWLVEQRLEEGSNDDIAVLGFRFLDSGNG